MMIPLFTSMLLSTSEISVQDSNYEKERLIILYDLDYITLTHKQDIAKTVRDYIRYEMKKEGASDQEIKEEVGDD